jgi:hypothetical protein
MPFGAPAPDAAAATYTRLRKFWLFDRLTGLIAEDSLQTSWLHGALRFERVMATTWFYRNVTHAAVRFESSSSLRTIDLRTRINYA